MVFKGRGLKKEKHFNLKVDYIIDDFLVKGAITLVYAPPKNGKSCLALAIGKNIIDKTGLSVFYLDFDNPIVSLKDKQIEEFISSDNCKGRFDYLHPDELCMEGKDALNEMAKDCTENPEAYKDIVLFFDSVTDFCNETDDNSAKSFMNKIKILRNAGATIFLLHHTNKKNGDYKGSTVFRSASDNVFALNSEVINCDEDNMLLKSESARFGSVRNVAFRVKKYVWELEVMDYEELEIPYHKREFIKSVRVILTKEKQLNQTKLLEAVGKAADDKTAKDMLEEFSNRYWTYDFKGKGSSKNYTLK